ncbi:hypothetical protein BAU15_05630 [Enterococcus sp. JM4C]|uniref:DUF7006 family protein n=1 Tax=Candidatus Enterococcus huntleyi TaxID=1857217 RepID=UPI00137A3465|nr:hypothetical protein [Enterococcus sp. JM4C]KAF1295229.1 hypothetical protein BAU15_05630 [Enterococcus sp. JM4C]
MQIKNHESQSVDNYFSAYDQALNQVMQATEMTQLVEYYESLQKEFNQILADFSTEDYLIGIRKILLIDAKLQILFFFWLETDLHNCTEAEIIQITESDAKQFYEESMMFQSKSSVPKPFIMNQ